MREEGNFFLKQYQERTSDVVFEIKYAEKFFAEGGLPVILPLADRHGRLVFWAADHWFSLFPFIEKQFPAFSQLTLAKERAMGTMLARFHLAGQNMSGQHFRKKLFWDHEHFFPAFERIVELVKKQPTLRMIDQHLLKVLQKKKEIVLSHLDFVNDLPPDSLLHGDFIYQNIFFDDLNEDITHVFDLERTVKGPRCYELARSLFINCFDDGFNNHNLTLAENFFQAYYLSHPISLEEFYKGIRLYLVDVAHTTWIEERFFEATAVSPFKLYSAHCRRIDFFLHDDVFEFCRKLYDKSAVSSLVSVDTPSHKATECQPFKAQ